MLILTIFNTRVCPNRFTSLATLSIMNIHEIVNELQNLFSKQGMPLFVCPLGKAEHWAINIQDGEWAYNVYFQCRGVPLFNCQLNNTEQWTYIRRWMSVQSILSMQGSATICLPAWQCLTMNIHRKSFNITLQHNITILKFYMCVKCVFSMQGCATIF